MKKNKYICPYCGAPVEFCQPFCRYHHFLFWVIKLPAPEWRAACSGSCDYFFFGPVRVRGRTLSECRRNWRAWYEAETAGLPDIPILAVAKFGKDTK